MCFIKTYFALTYNGFKIFLKLPSKNPYEQLFCYYILQIYNSNISYI